MKALANGNGKVSLEARVAKLEAEVERLKAEGKPRTGDWRAIVGSQKDNPFFREVVREMQRLRREDYAQAQAEADAVAKPKKRGRRATAAKQ